jgi:hypothetical protein
MERKPVIAVVFTTLALIITRGLMRAVDRLSVTAIE